MDGILLGRTRVAVLHNLPAPYRLQLFDRLLRDDDLEVKIFFTGRPHSNRPLWKSDFGLDDDRVAYLPGISMPLRGRSADRINLNLGIGRIFSWDPEVVVLYGYQDFTNILVAMLCAARGTPFVLSGEISYVWNSTFGGRIFSPVAGMVARRATCLAPASKSCAAFFSMLGARATCVKIIPPIPDVDRLALQAEARRPKRESIRSRFGLKGRFVVLYVGRLNDYKGIFEMFSAFDVVVPREPRVCLVVVGRGPLESYVRKQVSAHQANSIFLGNLGDEDLMDLFAASDIHILPSWYEAYGVVAAESLAYGVPSIVTKTSGCSDLIIDGVNGFLIEPRDPSAIAEAILRASSNPALLSEMTRSARAGLEGFDMASLHQSMKNLIMAAKSQKKR